MLRAPTTDDRPIIDLFLSSHWMPCVLVASDLGMFDALARQPASADELSRQLATAGHGTHIVLTMCSALGFLQLHGGRFYVTGAARDYLLSDSPFFWGGVFDRLKQINPEYPLLREKVLRDAREAPNEASGSWEAGQISPELAAAIARFMESTSAATAWGLARNVDFGTHRRLLDVGAGSGCFSIALAREHASLRCTLLDLAPMCEVAMQAVTKAGLAGRIDAAPLDMLRQPWPGGHDAVLLSNILHDWPEDTCARLLERAHACLAPGGRVYLHEVLLNDERSGPLAAAAFSVQMLLGTLGRQYSYEEFEAMLQAAGFRDVTTTAGFGHYSVVAATR